MSLPQCEPDSIDPSLPALSGTTLENDQSDVDPSPQVRFLQILANQVVEAIRKSETPPSSQPIEQSLR
jgi:hypothetical protein